MKITMSIDEAQEMLNEHMSNKTGKDFNVTIETPKLDNVNDKELVYFVEKLGFIMHNSVNQKVTCIVLLRYYCRAINIDIGLCAAKYVVENISTAIGWINTGHNIADFKGIA